MGKLSPKEKSFAPIFSETYVNFRNFFTVVYVLTGATSDPGLRVPRFAVLIGGGIKKQIFETGEKLCFIIAKKIRTFNFLQTFLLYVMVKI